jgi:excinuclease ABC subunit A
MQNCGPTAGWFLRIDRFKEHDVEVVTGVFRASDASEVRFRHIEQALEVGKHTLFALDRKGHLTVHSDERGCPKCRRSFPPLDPKNFSYNSSQGWCLQCRGFGELFHLPDVERGANADAVEESWYSWAESRETCPSCQGAALGLTPFGRWVGPPRLPATSCRRFVSA